MPTLMAGAIIQDMGYYPFGSHFFSDLVHYVRGGDFVESLLNEASDVNELAFALGALAHYSADENGHSIAINRRRPDAVSEAQKEVWRRRHLRRQPDSPPENRILRSM